MNLFLLNINTRQAAKDHCDKHCVKMILEVTQLLYSAWWFGRTEFPHPHETLKPYRATHKNHPVSIWVRDHSKHYNWAVELGLELSAEYTRRYGKTHKCYDHLIHLKRLGKPELPIANTSPKNKQKIATIDIPDGCKYFNCAIPDEVFNQCVVYKNGQLSGVLSYQKYYRTKSKSFKMVWNRGKDKPPQWWKPQKPVKPINLQLRKET